MLNHFRVTQLSSETKTLLDVFNQGQAIQRLKKELPPKPEGATRFVCISDTHTKHREIVIPDGDVLIHCGMLPFLAQLYAYTSQETFRLLEDTKFWRISTSGWANKSTNIKSSSLATTT